MPPLSSLPSSLWAVELRRVARGCHKSFNAYTQDHSLLAAGSIDHRFSAELGHAVLTLEFFALESNERFDRCQYLMTVDTPPQLIAEAG